MLTSDSTIRLVKLGETALVLAWLCPENLSKCKLFCRFSNLKLPAKTKSRHKQNLKICDLKNMKETLPSSVSRI